MLQKTWRSWKKGAVTLLVATHSVTKDNAKEKKIGCISNNLAKRYLLPYHTSQTMSVYCTSPVFGGLDKLCP